MKKKAKKKVGPRQGFAHQEMPHDHERLMNVLVARGFAKTTGQKEWGRLSRIRKALKEHGFPDSKNSLDNLLRGETKVFPPFFLVFLHHVLKIDIAYIFRLTDEMELDPDGPVQTAKELLPEEILWLKRTSQDPESVRAHMALEALMRDPQALAKLAGITADSLPRE